MRRSDLDPSVLLHTLDSLADGAYVTDTGRRILHWNRAAEEITGWPAQEVVGRTCHDNILVHIDKDGRRLCGKESCPLHRAIVTGGRSRVPIVVYAQRRDGGRVPVEVTVSPIRDGGGQIIGGVETFRDMTEMLAELERAKAIQRRAMETTLPADPRITVATRCSQCDSLGGDFHRVERIGADLYTVFLADVMGHGVSAALHAVQLRSIWEHSRPLLDDPPALLARMSAELHCLVSGGMHFATAVHLVIDVGAHTLHWSIAGHPGPLLFRRGGDHAVLGGRGFPLGLMEESEFELHATGFAPGDAVLLFTDGAVEVFDQSGAMAGTAGLVQTLRAVGYPDRRVPAARIEEEILRRSNAVRLEDDVTLIDVRLEA